MDFLDALGEEATEQLKEIKAARVYQGENPKYGRQTKTALGVIGAYVRLRATLANERHNDLIERRLDLEEPDASLALPK